MLSPFPKALPFPSSLNRSRRQNRRIFPSATFLHRPHRQPRQPLRRLMVPPSLLPLTTLRPNRRTTSNRSRKRIPSLLPPHLYPSSRHLAQPSLPFLRLCLGQAPPLNGSPEQPRQLLLHRHQYLPAPRLCPCHRRPYPDHPPNPEPYHSN